MKLKKVFNTLSHEISAALIIITIALFIAWQISNHEKKLVINSLSAETQLLEHHIKDQLNAQFLALERMAARWSIRGRTPKLEWQADAKNYVADQHPLKTVVWLDKNLSIRFVQPLADFHFDKEIDFELERQNLQKELANVSAENIITTNPKHSAYNYLFAYFPVFAANKFDGFILGIFDIKELLKDIISDHFLDNYLVEIKQQQKSILKSFDKITPYQKKFSFAHDINIYHTKLNFVIMPKLTNLNNNYSKISDIILVVGIIFALLIIIIIRYVKKSGGLARNIRENEAELKLLYTSIMQSEELVIITDANVDNLQMKFVNDYAARKVTGYSAAELLGKSPKIFQGKNTSPVTTRDMRFALQKGEKFSCELTNYTKSGAEKLIFLKILPVKNNIGQVTNFVAVQRDITKERANEIERETLIEQLCKSNEELDNFAYIASHDLKEPLRAISNHVRLLNDELSDKLNDKIKHRMHRLSFLTKRMTRLISDLLYFSRLGNEELSIKTTDLNELVKDIKETLRDNIEEHQVTIKIAQKLPVIKCDKVRVRELLQNLIINAIKYNDSKKKLIEIGVKQDKIFYVKDNGIGIDPRFHQDVFRIFKRLHNESEYGGGTGSGLTFIKKIIEQHGGKIWLESKPGKGTIFYFTLSKKDESSKNK